MGAFVWTHGTFGSTKVTRSSNFEPVPQQKNSWLQLCTLGLRLKFILAQKKAKHGAEYKLERSDSPKNSCIILRDRTALFPPASR